MLHKNYLLCDVVFFIVMSKLILNVSLTDSSTLVNKLSLYSCGTVCSLSSLKSLAFDCDYA